MLHFTNLPIIFFFLSKQEQETALQVRKVRHKLMVSKLNGNTSGAEDLILIYCHAPISSGFSLDGPLWVLHILSLRSGLLLIQIQFSLCIGCALKIQFACNAFFFSTDLFSIQKGILLLNKSICNSLRQNSGCDRYLLSIR